MSVSEREEPRIHVDVVPTEARGLQGRRAGLVSRGLANLIDFLIVLGLLVGGYIGVAFVKLLWQGKDFTAPTPSFERSVLVFSVIQIAYWAVSWGTSGRTYGDQLFGLRVVGRTGRRLHMGWATLRALLCWAFYFGLLWAGISRENRSVQDLILRTSVIHDWSIRPGSKEGGSPSDDTLGSGVDVQPALADEPHDGHPESLPRLDRE